MSLSIILGSSGSGKSTYIYEKIIREAKENIDKNFLVIVPEQYTMSTQHLLVQMSEKHCILNIDVLSFNRLAYRVFEELGVEVLDILDDVGKSLVLRKIVAKHLDELGALKKNITRITYIAQVKSLISEMTQYNITPDVLKEMINYGPMSESFRRKASDLLVLYEAFLDYTNGKYITAEAILSQLNLVLSDSKIVSGSTVVLDGFTGFTPLQYELVGTMLEVSDEVAVTVTGDIGENYLQKIEDEKLFSMSAEFVQRLVQIAKYKKVEINEPVLIASEKNRFSQNEVLGFLEKNLFRENPKVYEGESDVAGAISLVSLKNARDELKYAAIMIKETIRKEGLHYKDFAVVCPDLEQYRYLLKDIWSGYDIPFFIDAKTEIIFNPLIELIESTFEIFDTGFSKEAVFRFLRCGLTGVSTEDVDLLENYVISTGIRGKKKYFHPFAIRSNSFSEDESLLRVNEIRELFIGPLEKLDKSIDANSTVKDIACALYEFIISFDCERKLKEREAIHEENANQVLAKEYSQVYRLVMDLLDKMVALLGDEKMELEEFSDIFEAGLSASSIGLIPPSKDSVIVGDMERTRIDGIKVLFCLGASDNAIPKKVENGGILSQLERELLLEKFEMAPSDRQKAFRQRFYLYMMLTKPKNRLVITSPRIDGAGKACSVSYIMDLIKDMFNINEISVIESFDGDLRIHSKSEALSYMVELVGASLKEEKEPLTEKERDYLNALLSWAKFNSSGELETILDALFYCHSKEGISKEVMLAVNEAFNLDDRVKGSVSKFETYSDCAYRYFLQYIMRLKEREKAELSSIDMGNFYHQALERFGHLLKNDNKKWATISESEKQVYVETAIRQTYEGMSKIATLEDSTQSYIVDSMKKTLTYTVDVILEQVRRGTFEPELFEYKINSTINNLKDGEPVADLTGSIDRVDITDSADRAVRVIDYKSSKHNIDLDNCYYGTSLQLPIYMSIVLEKLGEKYKDFDFHPAALLYYKTANPFVKASGNESLQELRFKQSKMLGIVSDDMDDLIANDKTLGEEGKKESAVIPVKINKKGFSSESPVISRDAFNIMLDYSKYKAGNIAENILEGNFEPSPVKKNKNLSCTYCSFKSVCHFDENVTGFEAREQKKLENALEMMKTELEEEQKGK